jgi:hypothetical protein
MTAAPLSVELITAGHLMLCRWQKSCPGAADKRHGVPARVRPWQRTLVVLDRDGVDDLCTKRDLTDIEYHRQSWGHDNLMKWYTLSGKISWKYLLYFQWFFYTCEFTLYRVYGIVIHILCLWYTVSACLSCWIIPSLKVVHTAVVDPEILNKWGHIAHLSHIG